MGPFRRVLLSLALFQLVWARSALVHTTIPVLTAGVLVNAGALVLWAISRTAGAPFGPDAGHVELIAGADVCAMLLQMYVVMGAGWVWYRGLRGRPCPRSPVRRSSSAPWVSSPWHRPWEWLPVYSTATTHTGGHGQPDDHHAEVPEAATTPPRYAPLLPARPNP